MELKIQVWCQVWTACCKSRFLDIQKHSHVHANTINATTLTVITVSYSYYCYWSHPNFLFYGGGDICWCNLKVTRPHLLEGLDLTSFLILLLSSNLDHSWFECSWDCSSSLFLSFSHYYLTDRWPKDQQKKRREEEKEEEEKEHTHRYIVCMYKWLNKLNNTYFFITGIYTYVTEDRWFLPLTHLFEIYPTLPAKLTFLSRSFIHSYQQQLRHPLVSWSVTCLP